jgi:hypothetical protein
LNRRSSTVVALRENTLKLTPPGATVAPSGAGFPPLATFERVSGDGVFGWIITRLRIPSASIPSLEILVYQSAAIKLAAPFSSLISSVAVKRLCSAFSMLERGRRGFSRLIEIPFNRDFQDLQDHLATNGQM